MTTTLRDVMPQPAKPPKRNFLRENMLKIKAASKEKTNVVENVPPIVKGSYPLQPVQAIRRTSVKNLSMSRQNNGGSTSNVQATRRISTGKHSLNTIKAPKQVFPKSESSTSLDPSTVNNSEKQLKDTSCQTMDVNSELFLKDCIIRFPSDKDKLTSEKKQLSVSRDEKLFEGKDEHSARMKDHITRLSEFLDNGAISRPNKTQMILAKSRMLTERRLNKKNVFKKINSKSPVNSPAKETFHSAQELELEPDSNRTTKSDVKSFSSDSMKSPWSERIDLQSAEGGIENLKNSKSMAGGDQENFDHESLTSRKSKDNELEQTSEEQLKRKTGKKFQLPNSYRMGEVPKYLREIKEQKKREEEQNSAIDVECPAGHVPLSDRDRKEALSIAKKKFRDLVNELNKLPLAGQTLALKRRKNDIEKELNKLEESIKIFSRPKVYVKMDQS